MTARTVPLELTVGSRVEVTAGLSEGKLGVVLAKWPKRFGDIPLWRIGLDWESYESVIRQDYLRSIEGGR